MFREGSGGHHGGANDKWSLSGEVSDGFGVLRSSGTFCST